MNNPNVVKRGIWQKIVFATLIFFAIIPLMSGYITTLWGDGTTNNNFTFPTGTEKPTLTLNILNYSYFDNGGFYITSHNRSSYDFMWNGTIGQNGVYRGDWSCNSAVTNPEYANDNDNSTYGQCNDNSPPRYYVTNFSFSSDAQIINYTAIFASASGVGVDFYCKNQITNLDQLVTSKEGLGSGNPVTFSFTLPSYCLNLTSHTFRINLYQATSGGGNFIHVYEVSRISSKISQNYSRNVTIKLNNVTEIFNYGSGNNSDLNNTYFINLSPYLMGIKTYPQNLTFLSNSSNSTLEIIGLNIVYNNTLNVSIRDETTQALINQNMTIEETDSTNNVKYYWTNNGTILLVNSFLGDYSFSFYNSNYERRSYIVNYPEIMNNVLSVYTGNYTDKVTFTIYEKFGNNNIENASVKLSRIINGVYTEVGSKYTDPTGKAQFSYATNTLYKVDISANGYVNKSFVLDPILFSSYDILLDKYSQYYYVGEFEDVLFNVNPEAYINNVVNNQTITISSDKGVLTYYSISVTYPGGENKTTGNNPYGEQIPFHFNITNSQVFDFVIISFNYTTTGHGQRNYTYNFPITGQFGGQYTFMANKGTPYSVGIFERVLFATLGTLFLAGIVGMVAGGLAGGLMALLSMGIASYVGFIPLWGILPSVFVGLLLLWSRSSE